MGKKGDRKKKGQRHQNTEAFKAGKYGEPKYMTEARTRPTVDVCTRCAEIIEWRKKYNKYKPRTKPGNCIQCRQKTVTTAYHIVCKPCAEKSRLCAKCGKAKEDIIPSEPSEAELLKQEAEEMRRLKGMKERERRRYYREMEKGYDDDDDNEEDEDQDEVEDEDEDEEVQDDAEADVEVDSERRVASDNDDGAAVAQGDAGEDSDEYAESDEEGAARSHKTQTRRKKASHVKHPVRTAAEADDTDDKDDKTVEHSDGDDGWSTVEEDN